MIRFLMCSSVHGFPYMYCSSTMVQYHCSIPYPCKLAVGISLYSDIYVCTTVGLLIVAIAIAMCSVPRVVAV